MMQVVLREDQFLEPRKSLEVVSPALEKVRTLSVVQLPKVC